MSKRKRAAEGDAAEEEGVEELIALGELFFSAQESASEGEAQSLYQQLLAQPLLGARVARGVGELRVPLAHVLGGGQLPPSAVVRSTALNNMGELELDHALAAMGATGTGGGSSGTTGLAAAKELFGQALSCWPENAAAAVSLATMERDAGDFGAAVAWFQAVACLPLTPEPTTGGEECDSSWVEEWVMGARRSCVGVASYMLSLLHSQLTHHDQALPHSRRFGFRYRIAPSVWAAAHAPPEQLNVGEPLAADCPVRLYENAVPPGLGKTLRSALAPDAAYWRETGYSAREYFSFYFALDSRAPTNAVEELIMQLLPLTGCADELVSAEWWTHTKSLGRNIGHQLHYDMEEGILEQTGERIHPRLSSVVYLSSQEQSTAGPTLIFDEHLGTPPDGAGSTGLAQRSWLVQPRENAFMTFPGDRLHGVLPGPARPSATTAVVEGGAETDVEKLSSHSPARLTLMVAWWDTETRSRAKRGTAGPQCLVPRVSRRCSWPSDMPTTSSVVAAGTAAGATTAGCAAIDSSKKVRQVNQPWQSIVLDGGSNSGDNRCGTQLEVPHHIDQRFFVFDADTIRDRLYLEHEEATDCTWSTDLG
jgi:hypothetical protein